MTTNELIQLLQKVDPEGNLHIRILGSGCPVGVDKLPGYYDGAYSYYNDKGEFVITSSGNKVDIYTENWDNIIWDNDGDYSKIKLDMSAYVYKDKEKERWLELFEEESKAVIESDKRILENIFNNMVSDRFLEGWIVCEDELKIEDKIYPSYKWIRSTEKNIMSPGEKQIMREYKDIKNKDRKYYNAFEEFEKKTGIFGKKKKHWRLKNNATNN